MLDWLRELTTTDGRPRSVFLVHGEEAVMETFAETIADELGLVAVVPTYREVISLTPR
ncbi:MBL fold metallo-hydrolase RNA specificity domain-containing protein [Streptococcus pyogenes]